MGLSAPCVFCACKKKIHEAINTGPPSIPWVEVEKLELTRWIVAALESRRAVLSPNRKAVPAATRSNSTRFDDMLPARGSGARGDGIFLLQDGLSNRRSPSGRMLRPEAKTCALKRRPRRQLLHGGARLGVSSSDTQRTNSCTMRKIMPRCVCAVQDFFVNKSKTYVYKRA